MAKEIVANWGGSLTIRVPADIVQAIGLREGDALELEMQGNDILIRCGGRGEARERARRAADEMIAARKGLLLDLDWRELLEDGRRG